ncbi:MAG TPA: YfaZ family outer membrane protein [Gammaproteobacteria bacterium]|nr:YfaZ family outer membrane protein [Gammaproteobacteria bacterium]
MRLQRAGVFLVLASAAFATQAANIDFNLGSNAAAVDFSTNLTDSGLVGDLGYLHHTDRVDVLDAGLALNGNASPVGSPLIFNVGAKAFFISPKNVNENGLAIGVGANFRYTWPTYNRFAIGGELYYAPSIVSFRNTDRYLQAGVRAAYQVLRNADLYVGYRYVSAAFGGSSNITLDSSLMVGMSLTF